ncbi:MAG: CHAT domain-containing protein [Candidatus Promineifilaceae bacterium]
MASRSIKQLIRLSRYAQTLNEKQQLLSEFKRLLSEVDAAGGATTGERWLYNLLHERLEDAKQHLAAITEAEVLSESEETLALLDTKINDVFWEEAAPIVERLKNRRTEQTKERREVVKEIADWERLVAQAEQQLDRAQQVRAAVSREKQLLLRLNGIVDRANLALRDRDLRRLSQSQHQWKEYQTEATQLIQSIADKQAEAEPVARVADMHIMQSPAIETRFEYTILLRPPVEGETSGVNVQGETTIVAQDRASIMDEVADISRAINRGLARSFEVERALAETMISAETLRNFEPDPDDEALTHFGRVNANELVEKLGDLIYRLFIPDAMQGYFEEEENMCSLSITTNDLELPWELMRHANEFLCLERPIARMPMGSAMPNRTSGTRRNNQKLRFLLIYADPEKNLPLARKEILQIEAGLRAAWKNNIDIDVLGIENRSTGAELNRALLEENYDVIHYAGHARFNVEDSDLSSLLLDDSEFFAQKLRRLMKGRPLVFLNACESGQTANAESIQRTSYHHRGRGMAEGLAAATIYGGAVGCIGPLWPVYDDAAAAFAIEFYNQVIEGHMIGKAMQLARHHVKTQFKNQITWASFVLYGNPTYKLVD